MKKTNKNIKKYIALAGLSLCLATATAHALPMRDALQEMMNQHERILSQEALVERASYGVDQAFAEWLPSVDLSLSGGFEKQIKPSGADTSVFRNVATVEVSQKVFDFGKTSSGYQLAKLLYYKEKNTLTTTKQILMLEGIRAYLNVLRAKQALDYAIESEENIKKQTGMEEARVRRGSGLSTDVLQTKSTLAGAMATRARAQGVYVNALARFEALFSDISSPDVLEMPQPPYTHLPKTLEEALDIAMEHSLALKAAKVDLMMSRQQLKSANSNLFPNISMSASYKHRHNDSGTLGTKEEMLAKMDVRYTPFAGGRDRAARNASRASLVATEWQLLDVHNALEERVRSAWQNFMTAKANAQFLRNQAEISAEFLENARKERKLGKRSMMDLLNGETSYINTLSSAVSAETDMLIALYAVFEAMGTLDLDLMNVASSSLNPFSEVALDLGLIGGTLSESTQEDRSNNRRSEEAAPNHHKNTTPGNSLDDVDDLETMAHEVKEALKAIVEEAESEEDNADLMDEEDEEEAL